MRRPHRRPRPHLESVRDALGGQAANGHGIHPGSWWCWNTELRAPQHQRARHHSRWRIRRGVSELAAYRPP